MPRKDLHFTGLTGLRGIAAIIVVISHIDQFHYLFNYESIGFDKFGFAEDAVTLFFVLSGFLITYLLLMEKRITGKIDIKSFYMRRILRIWPTYYLALFVSLIMIFMKIISPPEDFGVSVLLYVLFFANLAFALAIPIRTITPLWSVGVEEQFYAVWPWIVKHSADLKKSLWIIILVYFITKVFFWHYQQNGGEYQLIRLTKIDSMAIGGLFALTYFKRNIRLLNLFYSKYCQLLAIAIIVSPLFLKSVVYNLESELKSLAYAIVILNVATNKESLIKTEFKILNFFGRISYGIYVYHMIIIFLISEILKQSPGFGIPDNYYFVLILVISGTVLVSYVSYEFWEVPFLKMKSKFKSISKG